MWGELAPKMLVTKWVPHVNLRRYTYKLCFGHIIQFGQYLGQMEFGDHKSGKITNVAYPRQTLVFRLFEHRKCSKLRANRPLDTRHRTNTHY